MHVQYWSSPQLKKQTKCKLSEIAKKNSGKEKEKKQWRIHLHTIMEMNWEGLKKATEEVWICNELQK